MKLSWVSFAFSCHHFDQNKMVDSEALTDANTLELLYQLVSRALSMVSQYTSKVKDEQIFRQTLWKAMKTVKQEQTALVSFFYLILKSRPNTDPV